MSNLFKRLVALLNIPAGPIRRFSGDTKSLNSSHLSSPTIWELFPYIDTISERDGNVASCRRSSPDFAAALANLPCIEGMKPADESTPARFNISIGSIE